MTTLAPRISVLMTAYNAAAFVGPAIESILAQSFGDFEFLLIDDGSRDATAEIIGSYDDRRIRAIRNPENMGLIRSLNRGLDAARGELIARMDADDMALPNRFETQVRFLDANPEIGLCGSAVETFGARTEYWPAEADPARLKCQLLFETNINHTTVMFRRSIIEQHGLRYDRRYLHAEDYALWARLADVTRLANLPEALVKYRLHEQSVGHSNRDTQRETADRIRREQLAKLGIEATDRQIAIHTTLMRGAPHTLALDLDETEAWLITVLDANKRTGYCDETALAAVLYERWFKLCRAHRVKRPLIARRFVLSPLARGRRLPGQAADAARLLLAGR